MQSAGKHAPSGGGEAGTGNALGSFGCGVCEVHTQAARIAICLTVAYTYSTFWGAFSIEDLGNSCYMLGYAFGGAAAIMSYLIDDVAKTLASPMPRRKAFRFIGGVVAGAFMTTIGAKRASAAACSGTTCKCNGQCCNPGQCCLSTGCVTTSGSFCTSDGGIIATNQGGGQC
jgi:hypothetical protein